MLIIIITIGINKKTNDKTKKKLKNTNTETKKTLRKTKKNKKNKAAESMAAVGLSLEESPALYGCATAADPSRMLRSGDRVRDWELWTVRCESEGRKWRGMGR